MIINSQALNKIDYPTSVVESFVQNVNKSRGINGSLLVDILVTNKKSYELNYEVIEKNIFDFWQQFNLTQVTISSEKINGIYFLSTSSSISESGNLYFNFKILLEQI